MPFVFVSGIYSMQTTPPTLVPALGPPTFGHTSFPNELIRFILLEVHPNDLITLASMNRHLRDVVTGSIDSKMAQYHISRTTVRDLDDPEDCPEEEFLESIWFNHPLLWVHHTIEALLRWGIDGDIVEQMWGEDWDSSSHKRKALLPERVQAVRFAFESLFGVDWPTGDAWVQDCDVEMLELPMAIKVAGCMDSFDLLEDILGVIPESALENPESEVMQAFFIARLALVPAEYFLLIDTYSWDGLLCYAIRAKNLTAIQHLLENGAVVTRDAMKSMDFQSGRDYKILRRLLEHDFDANWPFSKSESLRVLVDDDHHKFLKLLFKHGANPDGSSALHHCAKSKRSACIPFLLKAGADIDAVNAAGYTPLASACLAKDMDAVRALMDGGANLNAISCRPPLHTAVCCGALDLKKLFLDHGALVNFAASDEKTPLHVALELPNWYKDVQIPMLLLEAGADPTIRCKANRTPFHAFHAADLKWSDDVERLLDRPVECGADLDDADGSGKTIWQKLCTSALRNRKLLRWVLAQGGLKQGKIDEFVVVREWLLAGVNVGTRTQLRADQPQLHAVAMKTIAAFAVAAMSTLAAPAAAQTVDASLATKVTDTLSTLPDCFKQCFPSTPSDTSSIVYFCQVSRTALSSQLTCGQQKCGTSIPYVSILTGFNTLADACQSLIVKLPLLPQLDSMGVPLATIAPPAFSQSIAVGTATSTGSLPITTAAAATLTAENAASTTSSRSAAVGRAGVEAGVVAAAAVAVAAMFV
ncbi:hypothetical protein HDU96_010666 [Phlyctochytrium bullatum]|nr:hypothetical protein HDU96_010666 [Phlyctochytrium bullatum]